MLKEITTITVYSLVAISFQTAQFALTLRSSHPANGITLGLKFFLFFLLICGSRVCILGFTYPWLLATWVATILFSVQYRLALQRKVLGIIRIDRLLTISFTISSPLGLIYGIAWFIIGNAEGSSLVFILWTLSNLVICGISTVFMLFLEIASFLYSGHFSLL